MYLYRERNKNWSPSNWKPFFVFERTSLRDLDTTSSQIYPSFPPFLVDVGLNYSHLNSSKNIEKD